MEVKKEKRTVLSKREKLRYRTDAADHARSHVRSERWCYQTELNRHFVLKENVQTKDLDEIKRRQLCIIDKDDWLSDDLFNKTS